MVANHESSHCLWSERPMSRADWRAPGEYDDLRSLDAPGFAWEYLRRNPDFMRDRAVLERAASQGKLRPADVEAFARRWGVRFRRRGRRRGSERGLVDSVRAAERRDPDAISGRSGRA